MLPKFTGLALQDEKNGVAFGMVKEAIALGAAEYMLATEDIAPLLPEFMG